MAKHVKIAPSILSADFANLQNDIARVVQGGADWIHVDVMDGHFVPNLTIGPCVVEAIKKVTHIPLDVHLMITQPERYIPDFVKAGSDWLTFHIETTENPMALIEQIHGFGIKAGISMKPGTPIQAIQSFLKALDLVLIMSVEPGFGGQKFQTQALSKIVELRALANCPDYVSIDGGITLETACLAVQAGANVLVAGSSIFHTPDPIQAVQTLRAAVEESR